MPRLPEAAPRRGFPVVATVAPVIGSLALWAVMRSPYVLVFALLGPLVAVASVGDAAIQNRRRAASERKRFAAELERAHEAVALEHDREAAELGARHRNLRALTTASRRDPERWRGSLGSPLAVVAGTGRLRSALELEGGESVPGGTSDEGPEQDLIALRRCAETVDGAPVVVDARRGIGVCGPPVLAAACARGIVLQLANALSPADHELVAVGGWGADWMGCLPHRVIVPREEPTDSVARVEFRRTAFDRSALDRPDARADWDAGSAPAVLVALAPTVDALPRECRIVLRVDGASSARVLPPPADAADTTVQPELVSLEQARAFAGSLSEAAVAAGIADATAGLPESLAFLTLYPEESLVRGAPGAQGARRDTLACTPAWGVDGPVTLDLVADGPHAIVGGTTGSGKSEFLVSWVLAMAAQFGPDVVTFLLVDFKGGASFAAVQDLPHSVGLITDLDDRSARRALGSLRAELRYRERILADAGVRSIEQLAGQNPLPRLVIVVDEFAAMVQDFPELHELFADLASRGRSLGVNLILCTQRPAGVVRDAVLANCTLRVSLRVNNRSDSTAVIGSAAAAELPRHPLGRALLCVSGGEPRAVQIALARPADSELVAGKWAEEVFRGQGRFGVHRPWCDPLPALVRLEDLGRVDGGLVFGLADLPGEQRQAPAAYRPDEHGSLLVIGAHRSGKSGLLAALSAAAGAEGLVEVVPSDQEGAWDAIAGRLAAVRTGDGSRRVLLLDDVDVLLGSYPEEYAHAFTELVTALLREGGRAGTQLVLTACRLGSGLQSIATLCDSRLLLRLPSKQEHVLAGGEPAEFDPQLQPGGGHWRGDLVQVAVAGPPAAGSSVVEPLAAEPPAAGPGAVAPSPRWDRWPGWAIVTARPGELVRALSGGECEEEGPRLPAGWKVVDLGARSSPSGAPGGADRDGDAGGLTVGAAAGVGAVSIGRVVVADAASWQSHWGLIGTVNATMPILFDGCSTAEFRAISTLRRLPPPIAPGSAAVWMLSPDGAISRVLPPWKALR